LTHTFQSKLTHLFQLKLTHAFHWKLTHLFHLILTHLFHSKLTHLDIPAHADPMNPAYRQIILARYFHDIPADVDPL
jgi:hypothetical protein